MIASGEGGVEGGYAGMRDVGWGTGCKVALRERVGGLAGGDAAVESDDHSRRMAGVLAAEAKDLAIPRTVDNGLLARHAREHGPRRDMRACQPRPGTVCKILDQEEVKPHKVRYYLEQRDPTLLRRWPKCCAFIAK